jgi:5-methyltetrahydrofolate--homocysteine methyltransferase
MRRLCIADFYAPKESGIVDVFPMQAVTVGRLQLSMQSRFLTPTSIRIISTSTD